MTGFRWCAPSVRRSGASDVKPGTGIPLLLCNGMVLGSRCWNRSSTTWPSIGPSSDSMYPAQGGHPIRCFRTAFLISRWCWGGVLDELSYDRVDILGLSWGGALAQQFAFQNPRRCRRLVLVSTATGARRSPARRGCSRRWSRRGGSPTRITWHRLRPPSTGAPPADESSAAVAELFRHQLATGSTWVPLPTARRLGVDQPVRAAPDPPANPDHRRDRRPDHSRRQCANHASTTTERHPQSDDGGHVDLITRAGTFGPTIDNFLHPRIEKDIDDHLR